MENKTLYILTDYKGYFGSKYNSIPYNSGMDKKLLINYFGDHQITVIFKGFSDVINYKSDFWKNKFVIYTSSEDTGYYYKSYIEDIVYYLELVGAKVIPPFKYLKANNNKVFMELVRQSFNSDLLKNTSSQVFGTLDEMFAYTESFKYPLVIKQAAGAMSEGVDKANNETELIIKVKKIARTRQWFKELWETGRSLKYQGYKKQSKYRNKFIIQNLIEKLNGDFKVLIFGDKYYVLQRGVKHGDFRASGSGIRNYVKTIPEGLLNYAKHCKNVLNVPVVSIDVGYNGKSFFLIEYQCLFFGSFTLTFSEFYWSLSENSTFQLVEERSILEAEFARSIALYM